MHCSGLWGELILIQGAEFVKHSMFLQSLMHWQFCKQLQHENNERGRTHGGDWTSDWLQDIEPNGNQRAGDARAATDLYLTCSSGGSATQTGRTKSVGWEEKVWAAGQRSDTAGRWAKEKARRRRAGDGGARERSNISWLLFRSTVFSLREELDARVRTSAPRMLECDGWATLFFSSLVLLHISSSYPEAEKVNKVKIKQTGSILGAHWFRYSLLNNGVSLKCFKKKSNSYNKVAYVRLAHFSCYIFWFMSLKATQPCSRLKNTDPEASFCWSSHSLRNASCSQVHCKCTNCKREHGLHSYGKFNVWENL